MKQATLPLIIDLGRMAKAAQVKGRRLIYFECSRDDGHEDRQGESVAVEALWKSRELFLNQGDLDIAHWGHLPNPLTGRPMPEYRIGLPDDCKLGKAEDGSPAIFARGELFSSLTPAPQDSSGVWADRFWHSMTGLTPPDRWFPSVYGDIHPFGLEIREDDRGVVRRRITSVDWYSVGFARRAMHPNLPAVSLSPIGPLSGDGALMAKADNRDLQRHALDAAQATRLTFSTFGEALTAGLPMAKAIATVGMPETDHAQLTGVQALTGENLEGKPDRNLTAARVTILRRIRAGKLSLTRTALTHAFEALGYGGREAAALLRELKDDQGQ